MLAIVAKLFQFDALYGVFFAGVMLIFGLGSFWINRADPRDKLRPLRWIDFAPPPIRFTNPYGDFRSFFLRRNVSDAEIIQQQIVDRE